MALVVLTCVGLAGAVPGVWLRRNLLDTDRFVARMEDALDDPALVDVLTERMTEQVLVLVEPEVRFTGLLPEGAEAFAAPLASLFDDFVHDRVERFVRSDVFAEIWTTTVSLAHGATVRALDQESVPVGGGSALEHVELDLLPALEVLLDDLAGSSPLVPEGASGQAGAGGGDGGAVARLEERFQIDLPDGFAQLTVYDGTRLRAAREALELVERVATGLVAVTLLAAVGALAVSERRCPTMAQLGVGSALSMALVRRFASYIEGEVVDMARAADAAVAVEAVLSGLLAPLTTFATAWMVIGVLVGVVFTVAGRWGVEVRRTRPRALGSSIGWERYDTVGSPAHPEARLFVVGATLVLIALLVLL